MTIEEMENLIRYYIAENYKIKAQLFALQSTLLHTLSGGDPESIEELKKIYRMEIQKGYEELIANDRLLEQSWKKVIQENLQGIPGIDI